ncbi:uncharacterized protein [Phyllobates terribilis]|uniref:uncharacterized protein n=1 Tax=Phyllobates terribilis TaxID=111132 RepID=UPI003CCAAFAB
MEFVRNMERRRLIKPQDILATLQSIPEDESESELQEHVFDSDSDEDFIPQNISSESEDSEGTNPEDIPSTSTGDRAHAVMLPRDHPPGRGQKKSAKRPRNERTTDNDGGEGNATTNTREGESEGILVSADDYISPEEQLRRLTYCVKFLPSPLYKKERLMPTNPIAQRRCIEEYKAREKRKREERRKELKERHKYLDEEEDEEEEKEEEEKAAKKIKLDIMDLRQKTLKELCADLDEEEEEEEEKEEKEEKAKKMKLHIKIPRGEVTAKGQKRRQPIPTTRRKKENQTNFRQYINRWSSCSSGDLLPELRRAS